MTTNNLEAKLASINATLISVCAELKEVKENVRSLSQRQDATTVSMAQLQGDVRMHSKADIQGAQEHRDIYDMIDELQKVTGTHAAALNQIKGAVAIMLFFGGLVTIREVIQYFVGGR